MSKKSVYNYFDYFVRMINYACEASALLEDTMKNFKPDNLKEISAKMHEIETRADVEKHNMNQQLIKEFLPPIDREDIISLSNILDDLIDSIEEVLIRISIFNIHSCKSDAVKFASLITECCSALRDLLVSFSSSRKFSDSNDKIIAVNRLEERGDTLYIASLQKLFAGDEPTISKYTWKEIYERCEACCDTCEHIADSVEIIIHKNS